MHAAGDEQGLEQHPLHPVVVQFVDHRVQRGKGVDGADQGAHLRVEFAHAGSELQVEAAHREMAAAVGHVDERGLFAAGLVGVRGQGRGHPADIGTGRVSRVAAAQRRPAQGQGGERPAVRLHAADRGQAADERGQVVEFLGRDHVHRLHHHPVVALLLQAGEYGQRALDVEDVGTDVRVLEPPLRVHGAFAPAGADAVGGEGQAHRGARPGAGHGVAHREQTAQAGIDRGSEHGQDNRRASLHPLPPCCGLKIQKSRITGC